MLKEAQRIDLGRPAAIFLTLQVVPADVDDAHWLHPVAAVVLGLIWPGSRSG